MAKRRNQSRRRCVSLRWRVPSGKPSSRASAASSSSNQTLEPRCATRSASLRIQSGFENRFAVRGIENRQRHAPAALPRDHPIGPRFHRAGDAIFAPGGSQVTSLIAASALARRSSIRMKNCSTARKMIGVFERQQYGYECWIGLLAASSMPRSRRSATMSAFASKTYLPTKFRQADFLGVAAMIVDRRKNRQAVLVT